MRRSVISAAVVIAAFVAAKAARDAIVLSAFDVAILPWLVAASALLSIPIALATGRVIARRGPARVIPILHASSALASAIEWIALPRVPEPTAIIVFVHASALGAVLVSGFWSITNERLDLGDARRHIGAIGLGSTLGGVLGGIVAGIAGTTNVLLVVAVLQVISAVLLRGASAASRPVAPEDSAWPGLAAVARSRLLRTLVAVVIFGAISATALDFQFKADLATTGDPLRALAIYYVITSLVTGAVQIALGELAIRRLGAPRAVSLLPIATTVLAFGALAIPTALATIVARGAELVARSSIYRAAYELLFVPIVERDKRPAKVVVDVGADRVGDLLGAQIVGAAIAIAGPSRPVVLAIAIVAAGAAIVFVRRLRASYAAALETSLVADGSERRWLAPTLSDAGDLTAASLLQVRRVGVQRGVARTAPAVEPARDPWLDRATDLRSGDLERVTRALGELPPELASHGIALLAWDVASPAARRALASIATRCTGQLVDALLDRRREFAIRRRLPPILAAGEPALATWGLWHGLDDPRFEVRYRCGRALSRVHDTGHRLPFTHPDVFAAVERELARPARGVRLLDDDDEPPDNHRLHHLITLLGFALPARPVQVALHALREEHGALHATAREYLETVLPTALQVSLWRELDQQSKLRSQRV